MQSVSFKFARELSQKRFAECSNNVNAPNEALAEMSFKAARLDVETIFHAHYDRITRVIAGVIRDPARAEELAVEVFLKWERTPQAQSEGAQGWLYRTAVRIALNELRRKALWSRCERLLGSVMHGKGGGSTPHEIFAAQEEQQRVRIVLSAIQPRQAELLVLRSNDLTYDELAATLHLNPASVGTLLSRALEAFRKEFIRRYGEERYGK